MINQVAKDRERAWSSIGTVILALLSEGLLTKQQVEAQLLAFLRHNWTKVSTQEDYHKPSEAHVIKTVILFPGGIPLNVSISIQNTRESRRRHWL